MAYRDWWNNVVVFKLPGEPDACRNERNIKIRKYLMNEAEVQPLFCETIRKARVMAVFIDSADSKKCKEKIKCVDDIIYQRIMRKWNLSPLDLKFRSKWVSMDGFNENTTRQQIIDYIEKNGKIKVKEKDIYLGRSRYNFFARIECRSNSVAQRLVRTQNMSELNGSTMVLQMESPPKEGSTFLILSNLDKDVTEQDIADHIKEHGKIRTPPTSIKLSSSGNQKRSQITFASNKDLVKTMRNLNCTELKGKEVFMTRRPTKKKVNRPKAFKGGNIKMVRKETVSERSSKGKRGKKKNQGRIKMKKETKMGWKMKAFKNKKVSKMHRKVKKKEKKKGKKGGVKKSVKV